MDEKDRTEDAETQEDRENEIEIGRQREGRKDGKKDRKIER